MKLDFHIFGRRVIAGYNSEPTLRFGIHRELTFTAYGLWPLLVGVGRVRRCSHSNHR